jgi:hypothetical protein
MKNIISKFISIVVTLSAFASNSLASTKEDYSFEQIPQTPIEYKIKESEIKFQYSKKYDFSNNLEFDEDKQTLRIKDSSLECKIGKDCTIKNKYNERVPISDFFRVGIDSFSNEELVDILIKISRGMPLEDIVLSKENNTTIEDLINLSRTFDSIAKIKKGKNFYDYKINYLLGAAELKGIVMTKENFENQKGSELEVIHGTSMEALVNAKAYFEMGYNWNKALSIEDLIIKRELFEGNIYWKMGWNYSLSRSMNEFWQFKYDLLTLGILQTRSEIDEIRYSTDFNFNLQIEFPTVSMTNTTVKKEFESKKQIYSQLVYRIIDLEYLSLMTGIRQTNTREEIKSYENKTISDLNGKRTEKNSDDFFRDYTNTRGFYGITVTKDIDSFPEIETSISLFGVMTNYSENNGFGALVCSNYLNAKLDSESSDIFLTVAGKGNFCDYFKEKIRNTINPLGQYLESSIYTDLLRESEGVFLTYSKKDNVKRFGGIIGFSNLYVELGQIDGDKQGNYFRFGSPSLQIGFNSEAYSNSEMHGKKTNLEISWVKKDWHINLKVEPMAEELGIEGIGLYVSKGW